MPKFGPQFLRDRQRGDGRVPGSVHRHRRWKSLGRCTKVPTGTGLDSVDRMLFVEDGALGGIDVASDLIRAHHLGRSGRFRRKLPGG
jgi:hypothetical protein